MEYLLQKKNEQVTGYYIENLIWFIHSNPTQQGFVNTLCRCRHDLNKAYYIHTCSFLHTHSVQRRHHQKKCLIKSKINIQVSNHECDIQFKAYLFLLNVTCLVKLTCNAQRCLSNVFRSICAIMICVIGSGLPNTNISS